MNHKISVKKLSWFESFLGMIIYDFPKTLFFQTRFGIHTFGLKFPIDILILDNELIVKALKPKLAKNSFFLWNPKFQNVVELEEGYINRNEIKIGDKIDIT